MKVYAIVSVLAFTLFPEGTGPGVPHFTLIASLALSLNVRDADFCFARWGAVSSPLPFW